VLHDENRRERRRNEEESRISGQATGRGVYTFRIKRCMRRQPGQFDSEVLPNEIGGGEANAPGERRKTRLNGRPSQKLDRDDATTVDKLNEKPTRTVEQREPCDARGKRGARRAAKRAKSKEAEGERSPRGDRDGRHRTGGPGSSTENHRRNNENAVLGRIAEAPGAGASETKTDLERERRCDITPHCEDHQRRFERRKPQGLGEREDRCRDRQDQHLEDAPPNGAKRKRARERSTFLGYCGRDKAAHQAGTTKREGRGADRHDRKSEREDAVVLGPERARDDRNEEKEGDHLRDLPGDACHQRRTNWCRKRPAGREEFRLSG